MIGASPAMDRVRELIARVAPTDARVLVTGESGTGKELVASAIHAQSPRRDRPFVRVNCAAIPRDLVESEMFGHEKGSFTGATDRRIGRFELAHTGTLFLDEVGDLGPEAQAKLLRAIEAREIERVGGGKPIRIDVRIVAATNKDLSRCVADGTFREDLYFRLNVIPIVLPPLRDRPGDIPLLAEQFRQRFARKHGMEVVGISANCMAALKRHSWPGNVRELQNVIERAVILCSEGGVLETAHLGLTERPHPAAGMPSSTGDGGEFLTMGEMEKRHVLAALERSKGNRTQAAKMLDISIRTLRNKLHEYNMQSQGDAAEEAEEAGSEQAST